MGPFRPIPRPVLVLVGLLAAAGCYRPAGSGAAQAADRTGHVASGPALDGALAFADPAEKPGNKAKRDKKQPLAEHPFPRRIKAPSLEGGVDWINVAGPIDLAQLRGKFVVLDFWTYCCINCMHVLPTLHKLEQTYPNNVVVIGVHSAKFLAEQRTSNITEAVLRYEIEHPVVNDADQVLWRKFDAQSWPTLRVIDPEGYVVAGNSGEIDFDSLQRFFENALPYYREQGLLDETPLRFDLAHYRAEATPLRFPGKILADEEGQRLFVADSNHNRIVVAQLDGTLLDTIGSGAIGRADGDFRTATFDHPQGMALHGDVLYVADTENHLLRKVDLSAKQVTTLAGTGKQGHGWPGLDMAAGLLSLKDLPKRWAGPPRQTALSSPWALWIHKKDLYIAMAGPHQIWKMPLDEKEIGPFAGNGREDIVDGELLPKKPFSPGYASFAQPSGLSSDGAWLYVADSEGSSIRAVPFLPKKEVKTVVGTARLSSARLFTFGDVDGPLAKARLQHCLDVAAHDGKLYVADTYNNKIKVIDIAAGTCTTLVGDGEGGAGDEPARFAQPAGLSYAAGKLYVADTNNHAIRVVDLASDNRATTLTIAGLAPPQRERSERPPDFAGATEIVLDRATVGIVDGQVNLRVRLDLPEGFKINPLAPLSYQVQAVASAGPIDRGALGKTTAVTKPAKSFTISLPISGPGEDELRVGLAYYYCREGAEGVCKAASVVWTVPLTIAEGGPQSATLAHSAE